MLRRRSRKSASQLPQIDSCGRSKPKASRPNKQNEQQQPLTKQAWLPILTARLKLPHIGHDEVGDGRLEKEQKSMQQMYFHSIPEQYKHNQRILELYEATLQLHQAAADYFSLLRINQVNNIYKNSPAISIGGATDKVLLLFDLDETLSHTEYSRNSFHDYEMKFGKQALAMVKQRTPQKTMFVSLRPHLHEMLRRLKESSQFQMGIFTASNRNYADEVLKLVDPDNNYFGIRLYRQHCSKIGNDVYVKDLRRISEQPLSRILLVDNSPFSFINSRNGIPILPYYHDKADKQLLSLANYLLALDKEHFLEQNQQHFSRLAH